MKNMNMKKMLIVLLVCLNIVLLAALLATGSPRAQAQSYRATDYVVVTGQIDQYYDALYVIDTAQQRMAAWRFDQNKKTLVQLDTRNLKTDFPSAGGAERD